MPRGWSWQTSITLVCPCPGACWSTSRSALCSAISPLAQQICPGKHIGRASVLVAFSASACQGSVHGSHNPHQESPMFLMAQRSLNALFSAPKVENIVLLARWCGWWPSSCLPPLPAEAKPLREKQEGGKDLLNSLVQPHSSGSPELLRLGDARG